MDADQPEQTTLAALGLTTTTDTPPQIVQAAALPMTGTEVRRHPVAMVHAAGKTVEALDHSRTAALTHHPQPRPSQIAVGKTTADPPDRPRTADPPWPLSGVLGGKVNRPRD